MFVKGTDQEIADAINSGISVFCCYEDRDGPLNPPAWYAVNVPMGFDYGHSGECGVGYSPVGAIRDLIKKTTKVAKE